MEQTKIDPRTRRTRKLIIDSFLTLSSKYEFHEISVKDITEEAMINRATFYNHFIDKYDLLEQVISERLQFNLRCEVKSQNLSIKTTIEEVFLSLADFAQTVDHYCSTTNEKDTVERILHAELTHLFSTMLMEHTVSSDIQLIKRVANMLSHTLYGMSKDWLKQNKNIPPKEYIESVMPFLLNGLKK